MADNRTPVLLIGFNRPDFLAISLKELAATGRNIYIAIDGPRDNSDLEEVIKSRQLAKEFAEVNCELQNTFLLFREKNLGCKVGVRSAIDWIFEHEEQAIILEDDIVFGEEFLTTMDSWLNLFRDRKDFFHLNGFNPLPKKSETDESYLCRYPHVWGWATWRDRWAHYDRELEKWDKQEFRSLPGLVGQDLSEEFYEYWGRQISLCQNGLDTWDIQWHYSQWVYGGFALTPGRRLTGNRGFDTRATHTQSSGNRQRERLPTFHSNKFTNPKNPVFNPQLNEIHDAIEHGIHSKRLYLNSLKWKVGRRIGRIILKVVTVPLVMRTYNSFRAKTSETWRFMSSIFSITSKTTRFSLKICKYIYWRLIRPLVVRSWHLVTKVCKYIYWRLIRRHLHRNEKLEERN